MSGLCAERNELIESATEQLHEVTVTVNGEQHTRSVSPRRLLSDFLRHDLELHGTHVGCEHGACGACTILLDGKTARSCITFAVQVDGCEITTIEGLADGDELTTVQTAMWEEHGLQCGFCTPAVVLTLHEYLSDRDDAGTTEEIREALSGTICRCTGYANIVKAVERAAQVQQSKAGGQDG